MTKTCGWYVEGSHPTGKTCGAPVVQSKPVAVPKTPQEWHVARLQMQFCESHVHLMLWSHAPVEDWK